MEDCYEKMSNAVPEASVASADPCIGKRTRKASVRRTKGDRTTGTECVPQNGGRTIMKKTRLIAMLLTLAMAGALLAGCGDKNNADNESNNQGESNTPEY